MSIFCLVDAARMYASSAISFLPEYRSKPVAVTTHSGFKGVPIAINKIASHQCGISKFKPLWQNGGQSKIESAGGRVWTANFSTLGHQSDRFMQSIIDACEAGEERGVPLMVYSVDEIFLDLSNLPSKLDLYDFADDLRRRVWQEQRIGCGVAIGPTVTFSKCSSYAAKKIDGYNGVCVVLDATSVEAQSILERIPVGEVWNVGKRISERLLAMGIATAAQLRDLCPDKARREFGITISNVIYELRGTSVFELDTSQSRVASKQANQQVFSTKSHATRLTDGEQIAAHIAHHCEVVCAKARKQKAKIQEVRAFAATSPHDSHVLPFYGEVNIRLDQCTDDPSVLLSELRKQHSKLIPGDPAQQPIYKLGFGASRLQHEQSRQFDLFADEGAPERAALLETVDKLNAKYGNVVGLARSALMNDQQIDEFRMHDYFTEFSELPTFEC